MPDWPKCVNCKRPYDPDDPDVPGVCMNCGLPGARRVCRRCRGSMDGRPRQARYCSDRCQRAAFVLRRRWQREEDEYYLHRHKLPHGVVPPMPTRDGRYPRQCKSCGKTFYPWRYGARYCSNACKQKAYRRRAGLRKAGAG